MQTGNRRLRELMGQEAEGAEDLSPAGDAAIRGQLRFVAEALAANAAPARAAALETFANDLPGLLDGAETRLTEIEELLGDAAAFETDKQFGGVAAGDPGLADTLERRIRVGAWMRWFLESLDTAGASPAPIAPAATEWMAAEQVRLADTIFTMDRSAKQAEMARGGPDAVASPEVVNRIGQAAMLQGHVRFLVEAIARSL